MRVVLCCRRPLLDGLHPALLEARWLHGTVSKCLDGGAMRLRTLDRGGRRLAWAGGSDRTACRTHTEEQASRDGNRRPTGRQMVPYPALVSFSRASDYSGQANGATWRQMIRKSSRPSLRVRIPALLTEICLQVCSYGGSGNCYSFFLMKQLRNDSSEKDR